MKHQHPPDTSRRRLLAALAGLPAGALLVAADCNAVTTPPPGSTTSTTGTATTATPTTVVPPVSWTQPVVNSGADGLWVPQGWSTKVLARTGEKVGSTNYVWSAAPDGAASFVDPGGVGWWVAINHEASSQRRWGERHPSSETAVIAAHRIIGGAPQLRRWRHRGAPGSGEVVRGGLGGQPDDREQR
jgi:hypothetical protein